MAVVVENLPTTASHDPILPWLWEIKKCLDIEEEGTESSTDLSNLLFQCISTFKRSYEYQNDIRFLKVWLLYMFQTEDYEKVYKEIESNKIGLGHSMLYEAYAVFLERKEKLIDASRIYRLGILRNAEPLERLKKAHALFMDRMRSILNACSLQKNVIDGTVKSDKNYVNPWSMSTMEDLSKKLNPSILKYSGYHLSTKAYKGKVSLFSLNKTSRNKIIEIGSTKYIIKGCAGMGGFAQVFKAHIDSDPDEVVALKIQNPPFPWEFYCYRQLDKRIPQKERPSFGYAHSMHVYSDYSILVCEYIPHGTLQDVINSYVVVGGFMEEVLCMYYTIEMLHMLETLHCAAGIIHGDFKPDNLLIRYARGDLTEEGFYGGHGAWHDQGLCLVDWGRGIDLDLFPADTEFDGDCRTSGFRCIEMLENRTWRFQVDTYGLCVVVHLMLHSSYLKIQKKTSSNGASSYQPKSKLKRYWNVELWDNLFTKLLNLKSDEDHRTILGSLRESFQKYMCSKPDLLKKLKYLLLKQRSSLCSS